MLEKRVLSVFRNFLKAERDMPALLGTGSVVHRQETTDETSLDCLERADGRTRCRSWRAMVVK